MTPLLGHQALLDRLVGAAERAQLHHALLLEGPQGIGKRTLANRLAMAVNCTADGRGACGACPTCTQIARDGHPDVIVVEPDTTKAARTIPVQAVREVVRKTQYHRYEARHRFVIIDPAEAMQEPAANALLKTLEEPPDGTGFLLITHNPSALLPTILSRCQRVRLGSVPVGELASWLQEQGVADPASAAGRALGCPGRALALAETGLEDRLARRDEVLGLMSAPLGDVYAWSATLTSGTRQAWAARVDLLLEVIEDLVRDAAVVGAASDIALLDPHGGPTAHGWAPALWPDGIARCAAAVQDARDDLEVFVSGKTVIDTLITALRREVGPAR